MEQHGWPVIQITTEHLRKDKDFMLNASANYGRMILMYADKKLRNDRNFMVAAAKNYGFVVITVANPMLQKKLINDMNIMVPKIRTAV